MPIDLTRDSNFVAYFNRFKNLVSKDDSLGIMNLLTPDFPLTIRIQKKGGKTNETVLIKINSDKQILKLYPRIFNVRMKKLIATQQLKDLTLMENGIMMSQGQIWWHYYKDSKKIVISSIANVDYLFPKRLIKK